MPDTSYTGVIVPLVTPLAGDGEVSDECLRRLIESVRPHVTGLMPALSTGEGWALTERQWQDVVTVARKHSGGLPVLAGIQLPETAAVIARARLAQELGVAAVVVTTPFRAHLSQSEIYQHYQALRSAVDVPLFVYNEKAVSGNQIALDTLVRICQLPGVVGVKESSGSAEFTGRLVAAGTGVPVFEGWENLLSSVPGVAGFIGPLANLEPALCQEMLAAPTASRQREIDTWCQRHRLFDEHWYRHLKRELRRRGVIATDRTCADREEGH